jgi:hypothetical protein
MLCVVAGSIRGAAANRNRAPFDGLLRWHGKHSLIHAHIEPGNVRWNYPGAECDVLFMW